jgi:osmotically-inducible protein OsmY
MFAMEFSGMPLATSANQCNFAICSVPIRTSGALEVLNPGADSDHRLAEQVLKAILQTGYVRMRHIRITAESGTIKLSGEVRSYYLKQLAQQKAMSVDGVQRIANELQVR